MPAQRTQSIGWLITGHTLRLHASVTEATMRADHEGRVAQLGFYLRRSNVLHSEERSYAHQLTLPNLSDRATLAAFNSN